MLQIRKSDERGHANHGWLNAKHTFSFSDYYDDRFVGYRSLRVINEDIIAADQGFGMHPHKSMEILTYILEGAVEHKDSMGNHGIIRPGDVQYMSAGTGVVHSEVNPSKTDRTHLLQIWIMPEKQGGTPLYGQKSFPREERMNRLRLIASHDGKEDSITIRQNAFLYASLLEAGKTIQYPTQNDRYLWLQMAKGKIDINGQTVEAGDGVALHDVSELNLKAVENAEFLLFDLS